MVSLSNKIKATGVIPRFFISIHIEYLLKWCYDGYIKQKSKVTLEVNMKYFYYGGWIQIMTGVSALMGFLTVAYGGWLIAFTFLGLSTLAAIFLTIKDAASLKAKSGDRETSFSEIARPVAMFYGCVLGGLVFCILIGMLMGII